MIHAILLHNYSKNPEKLDGWITAAESLGVALHPFYSKDIDVCLGNGRSIYLNHEKLPFEPKFVISRVLGMGNNGQPSIVLRQLQSQGVPCFNQADSLVLAANKVASLQRLEEENLPVIPTLLASFPLPSAFAEEKLGWPLVMKTLTGSQGSGVFMARDTGDYANFMRTLRMSRYEDPILIQKYLAASKGEDLRIFVAGGEILACAKRSAPEGDFRANFSIGGKMEPYTPNEALRNLALAATKALNLFYAGVDLLWDGSKWVICEINGTPGHAGISQATGLPIRELLIQKILSSLS